MGDKLVCSERGVVALIDAKNLLHEFACWCAEQALASEVEAGRTPDPRSYAGIKAKRDWIAGKITNDELSAAAGMSWSAAWENSEAEIAAWKSERNTAREIAAWSTGWYGETSAWNSSRNEQNVELERRLLAAMGVQK